MSGTATPPEEDRLRRTDAIRTDTLLRFAAALDLPPAVPGLVPPLWHWTAFLDRVPTADLGEDGHPRAGGIVESPPYPRRMFAGARLVWGRALPADESILREVEVSGPAHKQSERSGPMAFMTVRMRYLAGGTLVATEEQDLVYLPERTAPSGEVTSRPAGEDRSVEQESDADDGTLLRRSVVLGPPALFRFSALTYNTHRIHYDEPYVTDVEGYPGLVVHGPLLAVQLAELVRTLHGDDALEAFAFRARSPAFAGERLVFEARRATPDEDAGTPGAGGGPVLALTARRGTTPLMTATARLRPGVV